MLKILVIFILNRQLWINDFALNVYDNPDLWDSLLGRLYEILTVYPDGVKEYDLHQHLKKEGIYPFSASRLGDNLELFRSHFLLFHLLYVLRDRLQGDQVGDVEIHCLNIRLLPWRSTQGSLPDRVDPMRDYYMDLNHLRHVQRVEVDAMITGFWERLHKQEGRSQALAFFGLMDSADQTQIKRRYRQLAKEHHPDHGGQPERFRQLITAAKTLLE